MADGTAKQVIFISYSHLDEPERTPEGDIHWLTDIQAYLAPAANGIFELWTDENMAGGVDWEKLAQSFGVDGIVVETEQALSKALQAALKSKRTTVIGVRIDASGYVAQFNALREL